LFVRAAARVHRGGKMIDCPLCEITDGARASSVLAVRTYACAVVDENAPAPGRVLVVPRPHVSRISELSDAQATELMMLARDVAVALEDANIALEGVVAEAGNDAVDEESHLRITVIPRMTDGVSERQHVISDDALAALRRALA
jgi:histidine triad (HIT) family protein